jgi:F-type H+-transporting ATPase subunit a
VEPLKILASFNIGSIKIDITSNMVVQWSIIFVLFLIAFFATRNLKIKPNKRQVVVESVYNTIKNFVCDNVGSEYAKLVPFLGSMAIFLLVMNLIGLIGVEPPTKSLGVTIGMAIVTFIVVQGYAIKHHGVKSYMKGYLSPIALMLPLNILERIILPVSLSLRLFGNIMAGTFIIGLVYESLEKVTWLAQIGLPIALHGYFDIFDGVIQMVIFIMLTMINIKIVSEH